MMGRAEDAGPHRALPGQGLASPEARADVNQRSGGPLGDAETAALPLLEGRDREIRVLLEKRAEVALEIGVA